MADKPAEKLTKEQLQSALDNARAAHDFAAVDRYQARIESLNESQVEKEVYNTDMGSGTLGDQDPTRELLGAAFEPMAAMTTGALASTVGGLAGLGKATVYNPLSRLFGGSPSDAADLVRQIQGMAFQPKTEGGKTALGAISYPFEKAGELSTKLGTQVEEKAVKEGDPTWLSALKGTMAELPGQAALALGAGGELGKVAPKIGVLPKSIPDPRVKMLAEKGVVTTPGQRAAISKSPVKQALGKVEEGLSRIPLVGGFISHARQASVAQAARGFVDDALRIVGEKPVAQGMSIPDAIDHVERTLDSRYDRVLSRTTGNALTTGQPLRHIPRQGGYNIRSANGYTDAELLGDGVSLRVKDDRTSVHARGEGESTSRHEELARVAAQRRGKLESDTRVSAPEQRVYKNLQDRGWTVRRNPATKDPGTGELISSSPLKGVYEVSPGVNTNINPPKQNFIGAMSDILTEGQQKLSRPSERRELRTMVGDIAAEFDKATGTADGFKLKQIQRKIRAAEKKFAKSPDPYHQDLADYFERMYGSFREMVRRSNPGAMEELDTVDRAYAQLKLAEKASTGAGALRKGGEFTPAQTMSAVSSRAKKRAEGETLLAKGEALGQEHAAAASEVLGNQLPDSGSPYAMLLGMGLQEALAGGLGAAVGGKAGIAAGAAVPFIYSEPVLRAMQAAYLKGGAPVGQAATAALPAGVQGAAAGGQASEQQLRDLLQGLGVNP